MQLISILLTTFLLAIGGSTDVQQLPSIPVKTLDGSDVDLQSHAKNGKITVVSFWATWCAPCKRELDAISEMYPDWQEKYNMELIAVTIDGARALPRVAPMVKDKGWVFEVLSDSEQASQAALGFQTIPQTIVVDVDGEIVYSHNGYSDGDEMELEKFIAGLK